LSTPYHAKFFALNLTRRAEFGSTEVFAHALSDAQVDLNPHQIDAALFAARSPISKGALLADEVGLVSPGGSKPATCGRFKTSQSEVWFS
jgi:hypothetical protein